MSENTALPGAAMYSHINGEGLYTKTQLVKYGDERAALASHQAVPAAPVGVVTPEMVTRFLGWRLPADFSPDGGISFKREGDYDHPEHGRHKFEPIGTNLFTATQAKAMLEYVLAAPVPAEEPSEDLIEVMREDGNNYCLILNALGMEEDGDPVAEVKRLVAAAQSHAADHPKLRRFLDGAAGEGLEIDGVDAADLFGEVFGFAASPTPSPAVAAEPYGWLDADGEFRHATTYDESTAKRLGWLPLYLAAPAAAVPMTPGIPGNFITHRNAWRKALEMARDADDRGYWEHELAAYDRSFDRLWAIMDGIGSRT